MTTLKRIQVKGFKSIREMDLELRPLNILIGANGSGKSNFLSVFQFLREIVEDNLQGYVEKWGSENLLHYGSKTTDEILLLVDFGENAYQAILKTATGDRLRLAEEQIAAPNLMNRWGYPDLRDSSHMAVSPDIMPPHIRKILDNLKGYALYHFNDTTESAKIKKTAHIEDNRFLRSDGANLASILYLLYERYRPFYDRIIETIQLAAPFFDNFVLEPRERNPDTLLLEWREKGNTTYFNADMLSDGTLRFMCLATLLRQPNPPTLILIDEPELGLHPYAITLLAGLLKGAATKSQVIISTQSPTLVNLFEPEDIIVVDRKDKESTFHRLNPVELQDWLEDYSLSELWQKNVIGGRP